MWIIRGSLLIPLTLVLAWLALPPVARAVVPAPDGGYPNFNTAEGTDALFSLTTGGNNTAIGSLALHNNTSGSANTATGVNALVSNTSGLNTANGFQALQSNTNGHENTATGANALAFNTIGNFNTANGLQALMKNTAGNQNTANGVNALFNNNANNNTANGYFALFSNTAGFGNTANGVNALGRNTVGFNNTANGVDALHDNTTGNNNTANGSGALLSNTTGFQNTATGVQALQGNTTGHRNMADGYQALFNNTTGSNNIALGFQAGSNLTTGSNNIHIAALGAGGESNTIRLGKNGVQTATFIIGIRGATVPGGVGVIVDTNGHLGTVSSSERFKDAIKPIDKASEAILALKPVTFRYKHELDPDGIPQFGFVAEEVEKVNPDLVARDADGKVYTVRYEAVNAMLLNEFLKEHRRVQDLEKGMVALTAQLKEQAAQIQKVSAHLEMSKPATSVVLNNP